MKQGHAYDLVRKRASERAFFRQQRCQHCCPLSAFFGMLILQDSSAVPYRPGYYFYAYQSNYELVVTKEEVVFF